MTRLFPSCVAYGGMNFMMTVSWKSETKIPFAQTEQTADPQITGRGAILRAKKIAFCKLETCLTGSLGGCYHANFEWAEGNVSAR